MDLIITASSLPNARKEIALQTRLGNDINNSQILDLLKDDLEEQSELLREKFIGIINRPKTLSGIYNCHGMTFACKRTGIEDNQDIGKILIEDEYEQVKTEELLAGDIVIYFSNLGEAEHSGIIISTANSMQFKGTIKVLSKWGSGYEVIHTLYNCPYTNSNIKFYRCIN